MRGERCSLVFVFRGGGFGGLFRLLRRGLGGRLPFSCLFSVGRGCVCEVVVRLY